jgi:hypothetical protein
MCGPIYIMTQFANHNIYCYSYVCACHYSFALYFSLSLPQRWVIVFIPVKETWSVRVILRRCHTSMLPSTWRISLRLARWTKSLVPCRTMYPSANVESNLLCCSVSMDVHWCMTVYMLVWVCVCVHIPCCHYLGRVSYRIFWWEGKKFVG